ncbi:MAG: PilZ domain-containing protein [Oleiphilaceae bacterium]|nr:PilZ domain-containing protein [Oleiphilaceae bacterium]
MLKQAKVTPNLRHYHRVPVALEALLETRCGDAVMCRVCNLSRAGFMVECSPEMLQQLLPNREPVAPHQPVPVYSSLALPDGDLNVDCHVIYVRRVSSQCFNLGAEFRDFQGDDAQRLENYVLQQMTDPGS